MFDKMTIILEKSSLVSLLGLAIATCSLMLMKQGIASLVLGPMNHSLKYIRLKGITLLMLAIPILMTGLMVMLKSERCLTILIHHMEWCSYILDKMY